MLKILSSCLICFGLLFSIGCKNVDLQKVATALETYPNQLDRSTVTAGLKQALEIGTASAVKTTSAQNGFFHDPQIKLSVPSEMNKLASNMRRFGFGKYVDRLESQMNRSAELAAAEAKTIFIASISQMTITDAMNILQGPNDAATQYFRQTTQTDLSNKFKPVIKASMQKVGFYQNYKKLLSTYQSLPIADKPNLDIEAYILRKTLDGLFLYVAKEEQAIRENPAARVTDLLKKVFAD